MRPRLVVGIDVDGVLADQITGVLPRIRERHDVTLTYNDITDWCLPIKDSDIKREILRAQEDRSYVLGMAAHEGARRLLKVVCKLHRVVVITARTGDAATLWTTEWLKKNNLPYDEVIASSESKKSEHRTDVLIDDFIGNIDEFLRNTTGVAVARRSTVEPRSTSTCRSVRERRTPVHRVGTARATHVVA